MENMVTPNLSLLPHVFECIKNVLSIYSRYFFLINILYVYIDCDLSNKDFEHSQLTGLVLNIMIYDEVKVLCNVTT